MASIRTSPLSRLDSLIREPNKSPRSFFWVIYPTSKIIFLVPKDLSGSIYSKFRYSGCTPLLFEIAPSQKEFSEKLVMDSLKTIPIEGRVDDPLRYGIHGVKSDIIDPHPLESAYHSAKLRQEEMKRKVLANTYGTAFPMKMELDRQILSRFQRPQGAIPSSFVGLEAFSGTLEDFGFEDFLNDPRDSELVRPVDMHHGMEVCLGLSKGPPCPCFM